MFLCQAVSLGAVVFYSLQMCAKVQSGLVFFISNDLPINKTDSTFCNFVEINSLGIRLCTLVNCGTINTYILLGIHYGRKPFLSSDLREEKHHLGYYTFYLLTSVIGSMGRLQILFS